MPSTEKRSAGETYTIQAGTLNLQINGGGQIRAVSEVFLHPDYDQSINIGANDIALLKLDSPLVFTDDVQPVCLPDPGDNQPEVGSYVTYTGWGGINNFNGKTQTMHNHEAILKFQKYSAFDKLNSKVDF